MTLIEIVPVHLIDSDSKHLFVLGVDSFLDNVVVEEFVDVGTSCVSIVEDEGVPEGLCTNVEGFLVIDDIKQFFIELVGFNEVLPDSWPEIGVILDQYRFGGQGFVQSLHCLKLAFHQVYF